MIAEKQLLFSLLSESDQSEKLNKFRKIKESSISSEDFFGEDEKRVYDFICNYFLHYKRMPTLSLVEVETGVQFPRLQQDIPFEFWLDEVINQSVLATVKTEIPSIASFVEAGDIDSLRDLLFSLYTEVRKKKPSCKVTPLSSETDAALERHYALQRGLFERGVSIGFPYIDNISGGVQRKDLWVLTGATSSGKTFLLCKSALLAAEEGKKVLFLSLEMPIEQIVNRVLSLDAKVDAHAFRLGYLSAFAVRHLVEHIRRMREEGRSDKFLLMEGKINLGVEDILFAIRDYNPDVIYIDGIYMLKPMGGSYRSNWENVKGAVEELRQLAMDENVAMVASTQLKNKGERDGVQGIGYSYAIAQLASVVLSITSRDADGSLDDSYDLVQYKVMDILKGRGGERGKILIKYDMVRSIIEQSDVLEGINTHWFEED